MTVKNLSTAVLALLAAALVPAACESTGLVGGECQSGLSPCDGRCVDLTADEDHCGSCGAVCSGDRRCIDGRCGGTPLEGGAGGGFGWGGWGAEGGLIDWAPGGASSIDRAGASPGEGCVEPFNTPNQCGDCDTRCSGSTPICREVDGEYECVRRCDPPLTDCSGFCANLDSDPFHCGQCHNECPSRLCQAGTCVGAAPGHIVLMCMNYREAGRGHPQTDLLANAVFAARGDPVRVMAYEEHTDDTSQARVRLTLQWISELQGRDFELTSATSADTVSSDLNVLDYEMLLVLDQPGAPAGELGSTGSAWETALDRFVRAGGTVIVLNGGQGRAEMSELITNAELLEVSGETSVGLNSQLHNRAPSDSVGVSVVTPFLPLQDTCTFATEATPDQTTVFVVTDSPPDEDLGNPTVVHRVRGI